MTSKPLTATDRLRIKLAGLRSAGVSTMYQDVDLAIRFVANFPEGWPSEAELEGQTDAALFGDQASRVSAAKQRVIESGTPEKLEILRDAEQDPHWFLLKMAPDINASGVTVGIFTTILDIDDVKYREAVLKTLLRELSHRSKNLLAMIQSIASQTARSSEDLPEFLYSFRNRIQSMAQSQDLVTASDWRGAGLFALTKSQLQPLFGELPPAFKLVGQDSYLTPNAALHLGLALHELAIDSLARGALGPAGGMVELASEERANEQNEPRLIVTWTETFAKPLTELESPSNHHPGFSGSVLGRVVPQALLASVHHETKKEQMIYQLTIPESQYEVGSRR
ncbi:MAG: hypothetical protein VR78_04700 [Hoeflea sp. BRH_c9]|nr:MAG: hypothetical protein VR78_04700 [Hoeflea sp. BRH_c9]